MKVFHCDNCGHLIYFQNVNCLNCGHALAFLPDAGFMSAMEPQANETWQALAKGVPQPSYRLCHNYTQHQVCNWAVPITDTDPLCLACRQTQTIPNLETPGNETAWRAMELAKRRLMYSLLTLQLPIANRIEDPAHGIAYQFLSDDLTPGDGPVLTGHDDGLITINIAEADDAEREKRRLKLHEPYRTLLGHFRHEVGHYYWDRLIQNGNRLEPFRALFGDERVDYMEALKKHYENADNTAWEEGFISFYASSHPWEDWAESWAHYLHMVDALETAATCGLSMQTKKKGEPCLKAPMPPEGPRAEPFDRMIENWLALTYALNNLNRSLGQNDGYPFVLSEPVIQKLRFVHETILGVEPQPLPAAQDQRTEPQTQ